jgi:radical S-adenosyl methionine domain-containing protein 2
MVNDVTMMGHVMIINKNCWDGEDKHLAKTVNWYITSECNYNCKFCNHKNLGEYHFSFKERIKIMIKFKNMGVEKINFTGGDPLLHPQLLEYCSYAKSFGMTVSVTTNGYLLNSKRIHNIVGVVDWINLSVDSCSEYIEEMLGKGNGDHITHCIEIADKIHEAGIRLKVNTKVTGLTYKENMRPIIRTLNPNQWDVFQMPEIQDKNDKAIHNLLISDEQFAYFVERHKFFRLENCNAPVFNFSKNTGNSYFMITSIRNVKN